MNSYYILAKFYDLLSDNAGYEELGNCIVKLLKDNGAKTVLDLACGTGILSQKLFSNGFSVTGIDSSDEMLSIAESKLFIVGHDFTLINAKMQDFELYIESDACVCCMDSINHMTDEKDVQKTFDNVYKSLNDGGIFFFDVNSVYKHRTALNNQTYVFDEDDVYLVWDNEALENDTVRILLDFFVYDEQSGMYERFNEDFCERAYSEEMLRKMLLNSGFKDIQVFGDLQFNAPKETSDRLYFICRK